MSSGSFEKSVKGATKIKLAPPKSKYIEHILLATHTGEAGVAEIFRTLSLRLRDSTWTIVFKALVVVHLMIREGSPDVTLAFLGDSPRKLAINHFSDVQQQGSNIRHYAGYLIDRARAFESTKCDYVRAGPGRLKKVSVEKGLLRETEVVQRQIKSLLKCDLLTHEPENEISLTGYRLLTMDLLVLYSVVNEGIINILEHYFEMSRTDGERALNIYRVFTRQTDEVVKFLSVARHFEAHTKLEIPNLKHAPTGLTTSLEEYLNDPDFEVNRRQFLASQEGKKLSGKAGTSGNDARPKTSDAIMTPSKPVVKAQSEQTPSLPAKPAPDLIDFFDSIETPPQQPQQQQQQQQFNGFQQPYSFPMQQTGVAQQQFQQQSFGSQPTGFQQPMQTGFSQAGQNSTNPFGQPQPQPLQPNYTGAGFGGYTPQPTNAHFQSSLAPIPQDGVASFQQQQPQSSMFAQQPAAQPLQPQQTSTNPFRQSMLLANPTGQQQQQTYTGPASSNPNRLSTNPFAKDRLQAQVTAPNFTQPQQQSFHPTQPTATALTPQRTGTNPFSRPKTSPDPALNGNGQAMAPLMPNVTGSTNPFRQSQFINQATGQGWQVSSGQVGTMGGAGMDAFETVPVFPRPGQPA